MPTTDWRQSKLEIKDNGATRPTSRLPCRNVDHQPVEIAIHLDLARQAGSRPGIGGEIQHVLFHRLGFASGRHPGFIDVDMAGGAGASAAALGLDAGTRFLTAFSITVVPISASTS